jgi:hypothetical protein
MRKAVTHSRYLGIYFAFSVPTVINRDAKHKESRQTGAWHQHKFILRFISFANCPWLEKFAAN